MHVDCAGDGPGSVVAARHRRAKNRDDRIADEIDNGGLMRRENLGHHAEVDVYQRDNILWVQGLGDRRETAQIRENQGDEPLLAARRRFLARLKQHLDDLI